MFATVISQNVTGTDNEGLQLKAIVGLQQLVEKNFFVDVCVEQADLAKVSILPIGQIFCVAKDVTSPANSL